MQAHRIIGLAHVTVWHMRALLRQSLCLSMEMRKGAENPFLIFFNKTKGECRRLGLAMASERRRLQRWWAAGERYTSSLLLSSLSSFSVVSFSFLFFSFFFLFCSQWLMAVDGDRDGARTAVDVLATELWWMRAPCCFLLPATTATSLFSSFSFLFFALGW